MSVDRQTPSTGCSGAPESTSLGTCLPDITVSEEDGCEQTARQPARAAEFPGDEHGVLGEQILGQCVVRTTEKEDRSARRTARQHAGEDGRKEGEADEGSDFAPNSHTSQRPVRQKIGERGRGDLRAAEIHTVLGVYGRVGVALICAAEEPETRPRRRTRPRLSDRAASSDYPSATRETGWSGSGLAGP